ncbi:hypothetical protein IA54_001515 [Xanthomonas phaseoli pv. syngonii LMG 9055]|uniref:Uncharacterized protein n=1 Tax=Xanthomonas phaseoli pv. syngonii LMG 9055 TaxID=1437878 RepID=A0A1V9HRF7_9XANT|nr:hypothetical protein IA54_001515 [Xanthomonas phaseoli pv. syngonii LMG 9055]
MNTKRSEERDNGGIDGLLQIFDRHPDGATDIWQMIAPANRSDPCIQRQAPTARPKLRVAGVGGALGPANNMVRAIAS